MEKKEENEIELKDIDRLKIAIQIANYAMKMATATQVKDKAKSE